MSEVDVRSPRKGKKSFNRGSKPLGLIYKRRHQSLSVSLVDESMTRTAYQFIDDLLRGVQQTVAERDAFASRTMAYIDSIDALGNHYFDLASHIFHQPEILNTYDLQPEAEQPKNLVVVPPGHLKEMVKVPAYSQKKKEGTNVQEEEQKQEERHRRETIIGRLKKQYQHTLHLRYDSQTLPLAENRVYFNEPDTEQVEYLRGTKQKKQMLMKKGSKAIKYWQEEGSPTQRRKENRMPTTFKKSKDFIDRIDPTTNDHFNKKVGDKDQAKPRNSALPYVDQFLQNTTGEEAITVRHTPLSSVAPFNKLTKEKATVNSSTYHISPSGTKGHIKLPSVGLDRDQLSKRVAQSVHVSKGVNLRSVDQSQRTLRSKQSVEVSRSSVHLPKLHR